MFDSNLDPEERPITLFSGHPDNLEPSTQFRDRLDQFTPHVFAAYSIFAINVIVFIAMAFSGVNVLEPTTQTAIHWGANYGPLTATAGQWWRLLTCVFVHAGVIHLAFNMFALLQVGPLIEKLVGTAGFLAVYLLSGLAASMLSLAWNPFGVSVGASGAVFGLYGALLGFVALRKDTIPSDELARLVKFALVFVLYNGVYGAMNEGVDLAAHVGGLVCGLLCGLALSSPLTTEMVVRRVSRAGILVLTGLVVLLAAARSLPHPGDLLGELSKVASLEKRCVASYNDALQRLQAGKLDTKGMADVVERDVLRPWSLERDTLASLLRQLTPGKQKRAGEHLVEYFTARQEAWDVIVQGLRTHNNALLRQGLLKQTQAMQVAKQLNNIP